MGKGCATHRGGALHLVDAENLAGDAYPGATAVLRAIEQFDELSGREHGDLVVLAANRFLLRDVVFDLPFHGCRRPAVGPDGADLALLAEAPPEWVCGRFCRLIIGSGDHLFVDLATAALDAGLEVTVIGRRGSIARRFFDLGCDVRLLGDRPTISTSELADAA